MKEKWKAHLQLVIALGEKICRFRRKWTKREGSGQNDFCKLDPAKEEMRSLDNKWLSFLGSFSAELVPLFVLLTTNKSQR